MKFQKVWLMPILWSILSLSMFVIVLGGCDFRKPIKVGFVGGLTGKFAGLGTAGRNGVLLAVEEWNEAGGVQGREIVLIAKDDKQHAETAVAVDRELIEEGVVAIIGHMTSTMALATLPVINEAKILTVSPTASSVELSGQDDYFMRLVVSYRVTTEHLVDHAFHHSGLRTIAVAYDLSNQAFSHMAHDGFVRQFTELGGEIAHSESFLSGPEVDYKHLAKTLLDATPDGVLIIGGAMDTAMLCQHLRLARPDLPILLSGWLVTQELVQYGGSAVEGVVFVVSEDKQQTSYLRFEERFAKRFGHAPSFASSYGYNAANILFEALSIHDDPATLKETILQQGIFQGVQAEFRFDEYGDPHRDHFVVTIRDGKRVLVE